MDSSGSTASNQSSTQKMCLACHKTFQEDISLCPVDGTPLVSINQDENLGKEINDKYKVIELVGKGGMGSVYLAEDLSKKGSYVAIKMLHAQLSEDKVSVKRFQQEASAASDLHHPNLIKQYDYGMVDGKCPFLVMEYLQGDSLSEVIRENGPMNPLRCLRIFSQVMDGLSYAHNQGVVHRDIKPSNILLINNGSEQELVKVLDFGLAKLMPWSGKESQHLTKTGEVFGSPIYMSPEQCMGKKLEPSSDIYSLGITLYETLTGKPPFKGQNVVQTASKHLSDSPPLFETVCPELNLPLNLQSVVFKALEKDVAHRYLNMTQFKEDLTYAISGQGKPSAHMQAAMSAAINADATQPVKKVDIENLKASAQNLSKKNESSGKPNPAMLAGGILVLLLAGAGAFMFMGGSSISLPHKTEGTVYYLSVKAGKKGHNHITAVNLHTDKGIVKLKGDLAKHSPYDLSLGKIWKVDYKGDDRQGELESYVSTGNNPDVNEANNFVDNYFANLADKEYGIVFSDMLSKKYVEKNFPGPPEKAQEAFANSFKDLAIINYAGGESAPSASSLAVLQLPTGEKLPPPQGAKVVLQEPGLVKIMIDSTYFYGKPRGYELFTLKKEEGSWRLANLETGLSQKDWNQY